MNRGQDLDPAHRRVGLLAGLQVATDNFSLVRGALTFSTKMDSTGIDPVTSSMQTKHATICTMSPIIFSIFRCKHTGAVYVQVNAPRTNYNLTICLLRRLMRLFKMQKSLLNNIFYQVVDQKLRGYGHKLHSICTGWHRLFGSQAKTIGRG